MYMCEVNLIIYQYIFFIRFGYKSMDIVLNSSVIELGILGAILISLSLFFLGLPIICLSIKQVLYHPTTDYMSPD